MKNSFNIKKIVTGIVATICLSPFLIAQCPENTGGDASNPVDVDCSNILTICKDYSAQIGCTCTSTSYLFEVKLEHSGQQIIASMVDAAGNPLNYAEYYICSGVPNVDFPCTPSDIKSNIVYSNVNGNASGISPTGPGSYFLAVYVPQPTTQDKCPYWSLSIDISPDNRKICQDEEVGEIEEPCETCIGSFAPIPGGQYLIGAWAKEGNASPNKTTYDNPELYVIFSNGTTTTTEGPFYPQGAIIDGWQRIEEEITIPTNAVSIQIVLSSASGDVYFDDIRMFPFDASMKSYVYDPINMRLSAELDERHYATFYEYDEEGKLVRIKKETEKGVMTIQETKSNSSK